MVDVCLKQVHESKRLHHKDFLNFRLDKGLFCFWTCDNAIILFHFLQCLQ